DVDVDAPERGDMAVIGLYPAHTEERQAHCDPSAGSDETPASAAFHCEPATPACSTTLPHRVISVCTNTRRLATEGVSIGSKPILKAWSLISGCTMKSLISACRRSTMSLGVAAGAATICHDAASKSAKPCSATDARSGSAATRSLVETPSARTL